MVCIQKCIVQEIYLLVLCMGSKHTCIKGSDGEVMYMYCYKRGGGGGGGG